MVVLSKQFLDKSFPAGATCRDIHSLHPDCTLNALLGLYNALKGCAKFYLPVFMYLLAVNKTKLGWQRVYVCLKKYARSVIYGSIFLFGFNVTTCALSNLFGYATFQTLRMGLLTAGVGIFIESRENKNLNSLLFFNLFVQNVIGKLQYYNIIRKTRLQQTGAFMTCSGILLYLLRRSKANFTNLWFFHIKPKSEDSEDTVCGHKDSCTTVLRKEISKYFLVGYAWNVIKTLLTKMGPILNNPLMLKSALISKDNVMFASFLATYVGLYRFIFCSLTRVNPEKKDINSMMAGFLAGSTYYLKPNLQFAIYPFTTILQILYTESTKDIDELKKWPVVEIFFLVLTYSVLHDYFTTHNFISKYHTFIVESFTNSASKVIKSRLFEVMNVKV